MASSSSSTDGSASLSSDNRTYRSFFVDDEASEAEISEQSDSEDTINQRFRQKRESVPLPKRGQRNVFEATVARLEADAQAALAHRELRQASSHDLNRQTAHPSPASPSPPRPITPPAPPSAVESPAAAYEELTVETCAGPAVIQLPIVPDEDELSRETRIYDLEAEVQLAKEQQEITRLAGRIREAHPDMVPTGPVSNPPTFPSSVTCAAEISSNILTEDNHTDIEMLPPEPYLSRLGLVIDAWNLVKLFFNDKISFIQAEEDFKRLFGLNFKNTIWKKLQYINDLDPDELDSQRLSLTQELDTYIKASTETQHAMRSLPISAVADNDHSGDDEQTQFLLFRVRCLRSFEADAFTKINDDIAANRVHPLVLRAVYKALQPGYIYIEAQSMLSQNIPLASYLRSVPGLVYLLSPKISFPNEQAWSRKHERVKKPHSPTWSAPDATMPIYQTVTDVGFHPVPGVETGLRPGSWVIPTKGRYKGDVGLVVEDDYDAVDTSVSSMVMFIPRIKIPNAPPSKRPPKATLPVDFRKSPTQWPDFEYLPQLRAWCIRDDCSDPVQCQHQPYLEKRYQIFRQVIRGGFALAVCNISELRLVNRMPAGVHAVFAELPMPDHLWSDLHSRLPPPESWSFLEGDQVSFTRRFGLTGISLTACNSSDLPVGLVGTILKVHQYICDVDLNTWGHRSIPWYNLIKTIDVGQSVKISDTVGSIQEVQRVELGQSALASVTASRIMLAGRDGIVTRRYEVPLYGTSLDVWVQDLELVITLDPNSVLDHTDNTVYSRHFTASAPRPVFDEFSVVERREVHQRPSMPYHKWDSVARYDLRDAISITESAWLLQNNNRRNCLHPSQYYALGRSRPPGRLPWFGVRVIVDLGAFLASGEVRDVTPKTDNVSEYQVLVASLDDHGKPQSAWFDYQSVRRQDNHGHLHEFSTYTGRVPWEGTRVRVVNGPLRDYGVGVIKDVSVDYQLTSISGLRLELEFESGYVSGERRRAHVDYDSVRKLDNRFIHDGWSSSRPKNGYFQFKMGYVSTYSEQALQSLSRPVPVPVPLEEATNSPQTPHQPRPPYFRFADRRWKDAFQQDFWLLDRRIAQTLGSREIYIWSPVIAKDIRISFRETSAGLELRYINDHKGGRKTAEVMDPRNLSTSPISTKLKGSPTANGLYLICGGEHTGKLTRRVNYIRAQPPNQDHDIWVLQVVHCVWGRERMIFHEESIVAQEPLLRLTKEVLTLVHETDRERAQGNALMATLRILQGGSAPEYILVEGQAQKVQR